MTACSMVKALEQSFYERNADVVARALLGQVLVVQHADEAVKTRIVETEAYMGPHDLASHASKGRTKRTEVMFGPAGVSYVYLIYGMYHLLNVVVAKENDAQAVLIRAVEPISPVEGKTDGPGKLSRTLGITKAHNALPLNRPPVYIQAGEAVTDITVTKRVGIDYAGVWKDAPLRFYDATSKFISKP